jgi:thioredoxin reductase (NADPH)
MATRYHSKVLIIGAGPAGYTAGIYAARANLQPLLVRGLQPGGQLTLTTEVENFPGFAEPVQGPWLMEQMQAQAEHVGCKLFEDVIMSADLSQRPFTVTGDSGDVYAGDTLVIATGASARWLGLPNEKKFMGFGVSGCATCDGFFYRGKTVAVVGGGDTALEESLYLSGMARHVTLVHRRDALRGSKIMQKRVLESTKITVLWDSVVDDIVGTEMPPSMTGLKIKNVKSGAISDLTVDGLFVAIGHRPNTDIFKGQLNLDETGYILTRPGGTTTNVPGVFAAGDVQDRVFRQAVTAAGTGCMAAIEAERWLTEQGEMA